MKSILMRVIVMICVILSFSGVSNQKVSAASLECVALDEAKSYKNPSFREINKMLTSAALEAGIPPEVVKAVAEQESYWRQFEDGKPYISSDCGIGIMQITNQPGYDKKRLATDIKYNIQAGVEILSGMYKRRDLPKIEDAGQEVIENWYFPVLAYNGTKHKNSPLYRESGKRNLDAYQEQVFQRIEDDSFDYTIQLGQFPFVRDHFVYASNYNLQFSNLKYILTEEMHTSSYHFQVGDKVAVTGDDVGFRSTPTVAENNRITTLKKNTSLIIDGSFEFDLSEGKENHFVWYPVKTEDNQDGYISSAYLTKKLDHPVVNPVGDKDLSVTGKAPEDSKVQILLDSKQIGYAVADSNGTFVAEIPAQRAGSELTVNYQDKLNAISPSTKVVVTDETPPDAPSVNHVTEKDTKITGTAEPDTVVQVKMGIKTIAMGRTDSQGNFSVGISVQEPKTVLSIRVKDNGGNYSPFTKVTVEEMNGPDAPVVNGVTEKDTKITGTAQSGTVVQVKVGIKTIAMGKTNSQGNFSVGIPVQKLGTVLSVRVKDNGENYSPFTKVTVEEMNGPDAPVVNGVTEKDTKITGTAQSGTVVQVKVGIKTIATGRTDSQGNFSVEIPVQKLGTVLSVRVKDNEGNYSPFTETLVSNNVK